VDFVERSSTLGTKGLIISLAIFKLVWICPHGDFHSYALKTLARDSSLIRRVMTMIAMMTWTTMTAVRAAKELEASSNPVPLALVKRILRTRIKSVDHLLREFTNADIKSPKLTKTMTQH
jgi:hypothetical protein